MQNRGKVISLKKNNMEGKMANAYKGDYVKHSVDYVNKLLYNDLPIDELFHDDDDIFEGNLKKMLYEGEVGKHISFLRDEYYITNFGRVINTKRFQELTMTLVRNKFLAFTANARRWKLGELMLDSGWKYDMTAITDYYKSIEYPFRKEKC